MDERIARKEYYSIGDVCELTGLKPHVLRYWESQFQALNPNKNRAGNRVFRPGDIELILLVKRLLYEEKYTIEGARQRLEELGGADALAEERVRAVDAEFIAGMKAELGSLLELLSPPSPARRTDDHR